MNSWRTAPYSAIACLAILLASGSMAAAEPNEAPRATGARIVALRRLTGFHIRHPREWGGEWLATVAVQLSRPVDAASGGTFTAAADTDGNSILSSRHYNISAKLGTKRQTVVFTQPLSIPHAKNVGIQKLSGRLHTMEAEEEAVEQDMGLLPVHDAKHRGDPNEPVYLIRRSDRDIAIRFNAMQIHPRLFLEAEFYDQDSKPLNLRKAVASWGATLNEARFRLDEGKLPGWIGVRIRWRRIATRWTVSFRVETAHLLDTILPPENGNHTAVIPLQKGFELEKIRPSTCPYTAESGARPWGLELSITGKTDENILEDLKGEIHLAETDTGKRLRMISRPLGVSRGSDGTLRMRAWVEMLPPESKLLKRIEGALIGRVGKGERTLDFGSTRILAVPAGDGLAQLSERCDEFVRQDAVLFRETDGENLYLFLREPEPEFRKMIREILLFDADGEPLDLQESNRSIQRREGYIVKQYAQPKPPEKEAADPAAPLPERVRVRVSAVERLIPAETTFRLGKIPHPEIPEETREAERPSSRGKGLRDLTIYDAWFSRGDSVAGVRTLGNNGYRLRLTARLPRKLIALRSGWLDTALTDAGENLLFGQPRFFLIGGGNLAPSRDRLTFDLSLRLPAANTRKIKTLRGRIYGEVAGEKTVEKRTAKLAAIPADARNPERKMYEWINAHREAKAAYFRTEAKRLRLFLRGNYYEGFRKIEAAEEEGGKRIPLKHLPARGYSMAHQSDLWLESEVELPDKLIFILRMPAETREISFPFELKNASLLGPPAPEKKTPPRPEAPRHKAPERSIF